MPHNKYDETSWLSYRKAQNDVEKSFSFICDDDDVDSASTMMMEGVVGGRKMMKDEDEQSI